MRHITTASNSASDPAVTLPVAERRVDAPHTIHRGESSPPVAHPDGELAALDPQQLEYHAEQLATYLRDRLSDIDRREAQLHARMAQWEQHQRVSRLQSEECENHRQQREQQIAQREFELARRLQQCAEVEARLSETAAALQRRNEQLDEREQRIEQQRDQLRTAEQVLVVEQHRWQQRVDFEQQQLQSGRADLLRQRRQLLENLETHRASHPATDRAQQELQQQSQALERERAQWQARHRREREQVQQWITSQKHHWSKRNEKLNERRAALQAMYRWLAGARQDVLRLQAQALEMRLAAEQAWRCASDTEKTGLNEIMQRLRGELSDYYATQRSEAEQLLSKTEMAAQQLDERQRQFKAARKRWQAHIAQQRRRLREKAAMLTSREHQLDELQSKLRRQQLERVFERRGD